MTAIPFEDYSAICNTKARYCRLLDEKDWDAYSDVFTVDVVLDTRPSGGYEVTGRNELMKMVCESIGSAITVHQVHLPEMTRVDDDNVAVIWAMSDRVIWDDDKAKQSGRKSLSGYGHYREQYRRCDDGQWRIARTTLTRLHIELEDYTAE